jgi:hypothetical protein
MSTAPSFCQAFPNLSCFSPSFSKDSFGGFVPFQCLAIDKNKNIKTFTKLFPARPQALGRGAPQRPEGLIFATP